MDKFAVYPGDGGKHEFHSLDDAVAFADEIARVRHHEAKVVDEETHEVVYRTN